MRLLLVFVVIYIGFFTYGNCNNVIDVTSFGAVGDGNTEDSQAFLKAWKQACEAEGPQTLKIPSGKTFKLKSIEFEGPCKSNPINFHLEGTIVGPPPGETDKDKWIVFRGVDGLVFDGTGKLDGNGGLWWKGVKKGDDSNRPSALTFQSCDHLRVKEYTSVNSPRNHMSISGCKDATVSNVNIYAPEESPNTDGINISDSSQVTITGSTMSTGDDCVAINGGVYGVTITNVKCEFGHGISVGSLGHNGERETVDKVRVYNCTFHKTANGARIKTYPGGSGYARDITFEKITLIDTKRPIVIDQYYGKCHPQCKGGKNAVEVSNVKFIGFEGTAQPKEAIKLECSEEKPCKNIVLKDVNIQSSVEDKEVISTCQNANINTQDVLPSLSCST